MPATGMAQTPGNTNANSATAMAVLANPFSAPTNSPFDARTITAWPVSATNLPTYANDPANTSTGALSTGIGFGIGTGTGINITTADGTAPVAIKNRGFNDDYTPGVTLPSGVAATTAILTAIGGGKCTATVDGIAPVVPYVAQPLLGFGNGGSRDAGAGPAFTGFGMKMVTATAPVASGVAIETGFLNRTYALGGPPLNATESAFGSSNTASPAVT
jgi:hypothetical protein